MVDVALKPHLAEWARHIQRNDWAGMVLDDEMRLAWVSRALKSFAGTTDEEVGLGLHIAEAFLSDVWLATVHPESQAALFLDLAPFLVTDFRNRGRDAGDIVPDQLAPLLDQIEPAEIPYVWSNSFLYRAPGNEGLPHYRVNACFVRVNDDSGKGLGWIVLFYMDVPPDLVALLARGDQAMYQRMANLVEPGPRQAAVLFCDLHRSGRLSRQLPSATYFRLVRELWSGIDQAVAEHTGIIGKHAGDGASAFFLVSDLGSASKAVAAAIRAGRRIHEISERVFEDVLDSPCLMKVGIHWGSNLYMGQLVPGGRLDVTALGDEVNEAARLQETAGPHETLVSKQLLEQLTAEDAASVGLDLEKVVYATLRERPSASEKAIKDAGGLAVTAV